MDVLETYKLFKIYVALLLVIAMPLIVISPSADAKNVVYNKIILHSNTKLESYYQVTFQEKGLPSKTFWYVNLSSGQSFSSTQSTISFDLANGSYHYKILLSKAHVYALNVTYYPSPSNGLLHVNGSSVIIFILFHPKIGNFNEYFIKVYSQNFTLPDFNPKSNRNYISVNVEKEAPIFSRHNPFHHAGYFYINTSNMLVFYNIETKKVIPLHKFQLLYESPQNFNRGYENYYQNINGSIEYIYITGTLHPHNLTEYIEAYNLYNHSFVLFNTGIKLSSWNNYFDNDLIDNEGWSLFVQGGPGIAYFQNIYTGKTVKYKGVSTFGMPQGNSPFYVPSMDTVAESYALGGETYFDFLYFNTTTYKVSSKIIVFSDPGANYDANNLPGYFDLLPNGTVLMWTYSALEGEGYGTKYVINSFYIYKDISKDVGAMNKIVVGIADSELTSNNMQISTSHMITQGGFFDNPDRQALYVNFFNQSLFYSVNNPYLNYLITHIKRHTNDEFEDATYTGYAESIGSSLQFGINLNSTNETMLLYWIPQNTTEFLKNYYVAIKEQGLPNKAKWYMNLSDGESYSTTNNTMKLIENNGTYAYYIASDNKNYYGIDKVFIVNGSNLSINVVFVKKVFYKIYVNEQGLPNGTKWYMNLSNGESYSSNHSTITLIELNGTYSYITVCANKMYHSKGGVFIVNGSSIVLNILFTKEMYNVSLKEHGLPLGTEWVVNLSNGEKYSSTNNTISLIEVNGTYRYSLTCVNQTYYGINGTFIVQGYNKIVNVLFVKRMVYKITVKEQGLPKGTRWYVNISKDSYSSIGSTIVLTKFNGTYRYTVGSANKVYHSKGGIFTVNGSAITIRINFTKVVYKVIVKEQGLPNGTRWYVNLSDNDSYFSDNSTIILMEANGTYGYNIGSANKVYHSKGGIFTVNGSAITIRINFTKVVYKVIVKEQGLPNGTRWYMNLSDNEIYSTNSTTIVLFESNGTYWYIAESANKSYDISDYSYMINENENVFIVNGKSLYIQINFIKEYNSQNNTGQNNNTNQNISGNSLSNDYDVNMQIYLLIGIIISISAIDAVLAIQRLPYYKNKK
jgi:hypothetical protein